jgi:hypothetical protein
MTTVATSVSRSGDVEQRARSLSTGAIVIFVLGNSKSAGVLPPEFEAPLTNDMTQKAVNVPLLVPSFVWETLYALATIASR